MNTVVISVGGNVGDVRSTFKRALEAISTMVGEIKLKSKIYETEAWGKTAQPNFLNSIWVIESALNAQEVLAQLQKIEHDFGRVREEKWGERVIDLDIIYFNNEVVDTADLVVPHPLLHERKFVLIPLNEILPNFVHPEFNYTTNQLLLKCKDSQEVVELKP